MLSTELSKKPTRSPSYVRPLGRVRTGCSAIAPRSLSLDAVGRSQMPLSNSPRPSFSHRLCSRGRGYCNRLATEVKSLSDFLQNSQARPLSSTSSAGDRLPATTHPRRSGALHERNKGHHTDLTS